MISLDSDVQKKASYQVIIKGILNSWIRLNKNKNDYTYNPKEILENPEISNALEKLSSDNLESLKKHFYKMSLYEVQEEINHLNINFNNNDYLINGISESCLSDEEKKLLGSVNTPSWLAEFITKKAIHYWKKSHTKDLNLVGDLSCGPGIFLSELNKYASNNTTIVGVDKNEEYSCLANLSMIGTGRRTIVENLDTLIDLLPEKQYSLFSESKKTSSIKNKQFDVIVGNPPYVRSQSIQKPYNEELKVLYSDVIDGNYDLTVPFISHTIDTLVPNGIGALIVSSKFMVSKYGKKVCEKLTNESRLLEIIDFGDGQLFPKKTTYTCIIIFSKESLSLEEQHKNKIKITKFNSGLKWNREMSHFKDGRESYLPQTQLHQHPWNLNTGLHDEILQLMQHEKLVDVSKVFPKILQGVRTGANNIFVLSEAEAQNIEPELLIPFIDGTNIRKCEILPSKHSILWPYSKNQYSISILKEEILKEKFPHAWSYLCEKKSILKDRNVDEKTPWYGFSRSQNLGLSFLPKIFVREMMPSAQFAVDSKGCYSFSSGYALVNEDMSSDELNMWAAILSTPTLEFQLRLTGTQLHSGWFRILKKNLQRLKLPTLNSKVKETAISLSLSLQDNPDNNVLWDQLDDLVADLYDLTFEMKNEIRKHLKEIHSVSMPKFDSNASDKKTESYVKNMTTDNEIEDKTAYPDINISDRLKYIPVELSQYNKLHVDREDLKQLVTFKKNKGKTSIHRWYPYTQGYSAELVEILLKELGANKDSKVYDPFLGSGTTVLACKLLGIESFGAEISPLMSWVANVKVTNYDISDIKKILSFIVDAEITPSFDPSLVFNDYMEKAFAPEILAQVIGWRNWILNLPVHQKEKDFLLLALVSILEEISLVRKHGSHYRYLNKTENVGILKLNISTIDSLSEIKYNLIKKVEDMIADLEATDFEKSSVLSEIYNINSREEIPDRKADIVITSPPYLNRNNYFTQQKAELSLLNFVNSKDHYKSLVENSFKSHVEFKFNPDIVNDLPEINKLISKVQLSENNNPKIPHMINGYFEDLRQTLKNIKRMLNPGAQLAFVVGNTRWGGVVVPVDHFLALLAEKEGYTVNKILVARYKGNSPQQMKKFGRIPVRESIVILQWDPKI